MSTSPSPSESKPPSEDNSLAYSAAAGAGGRIVIAVNLENARQRSRLQY